MLARRHTADQVAERNPAALLVAVQPLAWVDRAAAAGALPTAGPIGNLGRPHPGWRGVSLLNPGQPLLLKLVDALVAEAADIAASGQ